MMKPASDVDGVIVLTTPHGACRFQSRTRDQGRGFVHIGKQRIVISAKSEFKLTFSPRLRASGNGIDVFSAVN